MIQRKKVILSLVFQLIILRLKSKIDNRSTKWIERFATKYFLLKDSNVKNRVKC